MLIYTVKRIGLALLIVLVAMVMLFGMIYLVPGDPASIALGPRATPEMKAALTARMGLDQPIPVQLFNFISGVLTGDLGVDVWSNRSVATIILEALPHTLALTALGLGWSVTPRHRARLLLGDPSRQLDRSRDRRDLGQRDRRALLRRRALLADRVRGRAQWLPAIGAGQAGDLGDQLRHLILPAFAIGIGWVGYIARLVRASMLEVMGENFIRTARAFGLPERRIVYRYALTVAILPTVALLGVGIGNLLSGAVFAEIVFARPGIGKLIYDLVLNRNYPVVMGAVLVTTILYVLATLIADLLAALLDPRVRANF